MGGRFPPLRPLGSAALLGDIEDDTAGDDDDGNSLDVLQFVNDDTVIWSAGDLVIGLSHVPWSDSLQVKLNGHELEPADWTYSASLNTVTIPAQPWWAPMLAAGVAIVGTAYYAYLEADDPDVPFPLLLPFGSSGWRYKQIARSDATDYSAAAYDDSAWTVGTASFGDGGDMADGTGGPHTTLWSRATRLWTRRTLSGIDTDADIAMTIRADYSLVIWLDGTQVYTGAPNGGQISGTIAASFLTGSSMKLACQVTDESASDGCYFDLELTQ